jgi:hypothetical protein
LAFEIVLRREFEWIDDFGCFVNSLQELGCFIQSSPNPSLHPPTSTKLGPTTFVQEYDLRLGYRGGLRD